MTTGYFVIALMSAVQYMHVNAQTCPVSCSKGCPLGRVTCCSPNCATTCSADANCVGYNGTTNAQNATHCIGGYWGSECLSRCESSCAAKACTQNGKCAGFTLYTAPSKAAHCEDGYYNDYCTSRCEVTRCAAKACAVNGYCFGAPNSDVNATHCFQGYYNNFCTSSCGSGCVDGCSSGGNCAGWSSNLTSTDLARHCVPGFYGRICVNSCASLCGGMCTNGGACFDPNKPTTPTTTMAPTNSPGTTQASTVAASNSPGPTNNSRSVAPTTNNASTTTTSIADAIRCRMAFQQCHEAVVRCSTTQCECFKQRAYCVAVNATACPMQEKLARADCTAWQCDCEAQFAGEPLPTPSTGPITDASPQGTAAFIVASILTAVLLIVTIALIVRPKHMRRTQFVCYTVVMIMMPIAALFNLLRSSQVLACAIVEFIFVVQLIAINIVELSNIERRKVKWGIKMALYLSGFVAYVIYFATAINDIMFFVFIMLTVLMLNITLIIELISDEDGDNPGDFPMVNTLNHIGEAMIIVGAIIAFVYQFFGDVNNLIGAYMSAGEFQVFLLAYNFLLIVGWPKSDAREAFRGFVLVLMACNIAIQIYALVVAFIDDVGWIKYVMLTASILGTVWGCAFACVSQAAFED